MCLAFVRLETVAIWGGSLKLFALRAQDIVIVDSSGTAHSASSTSSDRMVISYCVQHSGFSSSSKLGRTSLWTSQQLPACQLGDNQPEIDRTCP
ncbi:hypothetical protein PPTG_23096 [Phytophthora nicotianae INRA-310]|uniref:Uncharacterized protein n=1 Tax=Phytophthora nicotianae (strain INRA-310) TaxID=761204 RepID=W2Q5S9_PHYN3|nr:hypothetical protein PPTG_23096 [Phytophthora nicotianae INRA-310]ETN07889.1 hypothetical protein PPTG_23096 [Phytophthora nicotianae INRA-310]